MRPKPSRTISTAYHSNGWSSEGARQRSGPFGLGEESVQHLTPVEKVLDRLGNYKSLGERKFRARCPNHNGTSDNSLSIKEGDEGRILLHCFSGCDLEEILGALGLGASDLFERKKAPALKKKPRV